MNNQRLCFAMLTVLSVCLAASAGAVESVGTVPAPTLTNVQAAASATYDAATKLYTYAYSVSNGAASTGDIWSLDIDMANKYSSGGYYNGSGLPIFPADQLTLPLGGNGGTTETFAQVKKEAEPLLLPPGHFLIPFGIEVPDGWQGDLTGDGYASFWSGTGSANVLPGASISGLKLVSPGIPVIREMVVEPLWVPVFEGEPDKPTAAKAGKVERAIRVHLKTLGPSGTGAP